VAVLLSFVELPTTTYINMHLLHSAMDLGFNVMEQVLRDEIWETERVAERVRDVQNIKLVEKFQIDALGIMKMREEWLKMISGGKGYRSPVAVLDDSEESGMSGKVLLDLPTDPHIPIRKGIQPHSVDLRELVEVERTP
jgi:hypothetical protein